MIPKTFHPNWEPIIGELFEDERYQKIKETIRSHLTIKNGKVIKSSLSPEYNKVFRVFSINPLDVRVLIMGQSPYWTYRDSTRTAVGRAFAVPNKKHVSPSMKIILDTLAHYYGEMFLPDEPSFDTTLDHWEQQGVMLLNRSLTSVLGKNDPNIHSHIWHWFTEEVIRRMSEHLNGIIFNLWGNDAKEVALLIDKNKHYIVTTCHPQATNYQMNYTGFLRDIPEHLNFIYLNPFKETDEIIKQLNGETIDWIGK